MTNGPHLAEFTIYLFFAMGLSVGAIRASHFFYSKIVTCHPAKYHIDCENGWLEDIEAMRERAEELAERAEEDVDDEDIESLQNRLKNMADTADRVAEEEEINAISHRLNEMAETAETAADKEDAESLCDYLDELAGTAETVADVDELEAGEDYEKVSRKLLWLYIYNAGIAATTLLVLLVYQKGPFGGELAINAKSAMIIIAIIYVLNFSLRVTALVNVETKTNYFENITGRLLSFGHSFLLTLYFLALIGVGKFVLNTGFGFSATLGIQPSDKLGFYFTLLVLLGPLISSILSEFCLHPKVFGVRDGGFDTV